MVRTRTVRTVDAVVQVLGDLDGQLTGRGDDQSLRLAGGGKLLVIGLAGGDGALQQRDAEAERLAGAGAGLTDQVGAHQRDRECHLLDRKRLDDVDAVERVADLGQHAELSEGGQADRLSHACTDRCAQWPGAWGFSAPIVRRGDTVQAPRTSLPIWARHRRIAHQCSRTSCQRRFVWFAPLYRRDFGPATSVLSATRARVQIRCRAWSRRPLMIPPTGPRRWICWECSRTAS